jgi:hypothetical protein
VANGSLAHVDPTVSIGNDQLKLKHLKNSTKVESIYLEHR